MVVSVPPDEGVVGRQGACAAVWDILNGLRARVCLNGMCKMD